MSFINATADIAVLVQDIRADLPRVGLDVWVVDASTEFHLGRLEGVLGRKLNLQVEATPAERSVLRPYKHRIPSQDVVICRLDFAPLKLVLSEFRQLLL